MARTTTHALQYPTTATADNPTGRTQWVITKRCGCPRDVIEGSAAADQEAAWKLAAPLRSERNRLYADGCTLHHVTHAEYLERYSALMTQSCPHSQDTR
jgi:hypothetical protein